MAYPKANYFTGTFILWNFKTNFVYRDEALNRREYAICQRKQISVADMEAG